MSGVQHTPGPWRWLEEDERHDPDVVPVYAVLGQIADVYAYAAFGGGQDGTSDRADANARLIAAAPELLAALRETQDFIEAHHCRVTDGEPDDDARSVVEMVRAAIAKATGAAP